MQDHIDIKLVVFTKCCCIGNRNEYYITATKQTNKISCSPNSNYIYFKKKIITNIKKKKKNCSNESPCRRNNGSRYVGSSYTK